MKRLLSRFLLRPPKLEGLTPGQVGEEWITYLYQKNGYKVLHRNYELFGKKKLGELDLVCQKEKTIVIVEVRTRSSEQFMRIEESVDGKKQGYLRRMAYLFLNNHPEFADCGLRIDIAAVLLDPIDNSVKTVRITKNAIEGE